MMKHLSAVAKRLINPLTRRDSMRADEKFVPNAETVAAMEEAPAGGLPRFASVEALMADLESEDPH